MAQNPDFLKPRTPVSAPAAKAPQPIPQPTAPAAKPGKLSFKDQHRLKELDALIHALPADIAAYEATLVDVNFYARENNPGLNVY